MKRYNKHTILSGFLLLTGLLALAPAQAAVTPGTKTCGDYEYFVEKVKGGSIKYSIVSAPCTWRIVAVPDSTLGWHFAYWDDNCHLTDTVRIINLDDYKAEDEVIFMAIFSSEEEPIEGTIRDYDIKSTPVASDKGHGRITYEYSASGDSILLTAVPDEGFVFAQWADGTAVNPRVITDYSSNDTTFIASFMLKVKSGGEVYKWSDDQLLVITPDNIDDNDIEYYDIATVFAAGEHIYCTDNTSAFMIDSGFFAIPAPGVDGNAGDTLHIVYKKTSSGSPVAYRDYVIPVLVSGTQTITTMPSKTVGLVGLHVLNGGVATLSDGLTLGELCIYPGGKAIIPSGATVNVASVVMRADGINDLYPQFVVNGTLNNANNDTIYYDYAMDYHNFYPFSVPYEVDHTAVAWYPEDTGTPYRAPSYRLDYYDGNARNYLVESYAESGWTVFRDDLYNIPAMVGFTAYAVPRIWYRQTGHKERTHTGIVRFPMVKDFSGGSGESDVEVIIPASGDPATVPDAKRNISLIGSPFLADYEGDILWYEGDGSGGYASTPEPLQYVTITENGFKTFTSVLREEMTYQAFHSYVVQSSDNGDKLKFEVSRRVQNAPARRANQSPEQWRLRTGVMLTQGANSDKAGLLIGTRYTYAYDFNADLAKMIGSQQGLAFYSLTNGEKMAFNALPAGDANELIIPLGYQGATLGTELVFSYDAARYGETPDEKIEALYLIDYLSEDQTDLLTSDYVCMPTETSSNTRFSLNVIFHAPQQEEEQGDATGCEEVRSTALPDGTYDLLGRPIRSNANALPAGVYIVVRDGKAEKEVIR